MKQARHEFRSLDKFSLRGLDPQISFPWLPKRIAGSSPATVNNRSSIEPEMHDVTVPDDIVL
ncbi:hypothetical protein, partial [Aestuariivirga sp.]|uniref:hypothetical protein n=1 Tax=Aestuariivirga sp. TaxID=2650926 RepID=UPI003019146D